MRLQFRKDLDWVGNSLRVGIIGHLQCTVHSCMRSVGTPCNTFASYSGCRDEEIGWPIIFRGPMIGTYSYLGPIWVLLKNNAVLEEEHFVHGIFFGGCRSEEIGCTILLQDLATGTIS
jgi:hypothetical protein